MGISGWTYEGWRGNFYPRKLAVKQELHYASRTFPTIEINGTFYALQRPSSWHRWFETTPDDFIFSVKANRYITHVKRLHEIEIPMANFFSSGILSLGHKLGPILWQFPPSMRFDPERWKHFLQLLPRDLKLARMLGSLSVLRKDRVDLHITENLPLRHAVEVRHDSFLNPWFIELLREYNVALVFADNGGKWPYMEDVTSDFLYLRLHGPSELYKSGYDDDSLDFWARRILNWSQGHEPRDRLNLTNAYPAGARREVFVYFDNDVKALAPRDAQTLLKKLAFAPGLLHLPRMEGEYSAQN